ncbi:esterase family protein [Bacillus timonensis]|nr:esterase family protein [Bacillus timonensis]
MEMAKGSIKELTIQSKALGEAVELLVYLPATFSPLYKYSILIAQDGRDYFQLGRIARVADELLHNKEIDNTIIVGIPYKDVNDRREKYHTRGEKNEAYIRFLGEELVPFLDEEFPTYQMGLGRALIGDSLGATVSLMAALSYPHTFGKVMLQSPYINDYVVQQVEEFKEPHLLSLYHVIGTEETAVETTHGKTKDFVTPNRRISEIFKQKKFSYFYDEFEGNHTWTYWQPDLIRALQMMMKF